MKIRQANTMDNAGIFQLESMGMAIARLRMARKVRQQDAAVRAGISRTTAHLIEHGSPSVAIGQVLRYIDAIAPGKTLASLLNEVDPSVITLEAGEKRKRARALSEKELQELDF